MDWFYVGETKPIIVECKDGAGNVFPLQQTDTLTIVLVRMSGGRIEKPATLTNDGSDGLMQCQPDLSDFTAGDAGDCTVQGVVRRAGASTLYTKPKYIHIFLPV